MKAKPLLTISTLTGVLPLTVGSLVFWVYFFFPDKNEPFIFGYWTILISAPLCFIGLILTAIFESKNKSEMSLRKKAKRNFILILSNIPFCVFYLWFAFYLMDTERITIVNNSENTITDIQVFGIGDDHQISTIEKGESETIWIHLTEEGSIRMTYTEKGQAKRRIIDPYPTGGHRYNYHIMPTEEELKGFK